MKVLITAPPLLRAMAEFRPIFAERGVETYEPDIVQTLSETELLAIIDRFDGWIAGDCPVTAAVLSKGKAARLKAVVKWGVGVDNVDFRAAASLGIRISNTPGVFGSEVADVALGYVIALARETFLIDREVREGRWPKPAGLSLDQTRALVVGFGNIGQAVVKRLRACDVRVSVYDPAAAAAPQGCDPFNWPSDLASMDFIVLCCALNDTNRHMLDAASLGLCKQGVRIVNVSRGGLIDEPALVRALNTGVVHSAALEVFEVEPLPLESPLRAHPRCIFGSHNASNTAQAVERATRRALALLFEFLKVPAPVASR